jgi:hypothetical protein
MHFSKMWLRVVEEHMIACDTAQATTYATYQENICAALDYILQK